LPDPATRRRAAAGRGVVEAYSDGAEIAERPLRTPPVRGWLDSCEALASETTRPSGGALDRGSNSTPNDL
jgi:hypothetical protein